RPSRARAAFLVSWRSGGQGSGHVRSGLVAFALPLGHHFADNRRHRSWDVRPKLIHRVRLMRLQVRQHRSDRVTTEGQYTGKEVVKRNTQTIDIRLSSHLSWISNLLGCRESKSP